MPQLGSTAVLLRAGDEFLKIFKSKNRSYRRFACIRNKIKTIKRLEKTTCSLSMSSEK